MDLGVVRALLQDFLKTLGPFQIFLFDIESIPQSAEPNFVVRSERQIMTEKHLAIAPIAELVNSETSANNEDAGANKAKPSPAGLTNPTRLIDPPNDHRKKAHRRNVSIAIRHGLQTHLNQADYRDETSHEPE